MNLAAILGVCCALSVSAGTAAISSGRLDQDNTAPQPQTSSQPQAQPSEPAKPAAASTGETPASAARAKPAAAKARRHKKTAAPNCSTATAPAAGNSADAAKPADAAAGSSLPPCPTPKKVVRNGGSNEPAIQLTGDTTAEHAEEQRSTDQLAAATEANLKKIAGHELTPSQQEMVRQIKQFMDQSKEAVAAGDLERGHNLAAKAQLLSEELVKP